MQETTLLRFQENKQWGIKDTNGHCVVKPVYDNALVVDSADGYPQNIFWVRLNEKEGIIDDKGQFLISLEYESVDVINDGYFACCKDGAYGVLNLENKVILDFQYEEIFEYVDGLFSVCKDDVYGLVDKTNQIVLPLQYDELSFAYPGLYIVQKDSLYYLVDTQGQSIIEKGYRDITSLSDGTILLQDSDTYFYTNLRDLKRICECERDVNGIYSSDGKNLLDIQYADHKIFRVSAGVENLAAHSGYKKPYPLCAYGVKSLVFDKGVTRIGKGWQSPVSCGQEDKVAIYLPSTLRSIDSTAFCDIVDDISAIYVPSESIREIETLLPSQLRPLLKESGSWRSVFAAWKDATPKQWCLSPLSTLTAPIDQISFKFLQSIVGVTLGLIPVFLWIFGLWGYSRTFDSSFGGVVKIVSAVIIIGVVYHQWVKRKFAINAIKSIQFAVECVFAFVCVFGILIALTFGLNAYIVQDSQEIEGRVVDIVRYEKGNGAIIEIPFAPYRYEKRVGKADPAMGSPVKIHYHKGYLGILVEDDVEFQ